MESNKTVGLGNPQDYYPVFNINKLKEKPKLSDKIIHEMSVRHMIDETKLRLAIESQFKFVAETFIKGEYKSIRLQNFGLFGVKQGRRDWKERLIKEKEKEKETNEQTEGNIDRLG